VFFSEVLRNAGCTHETAEKKASRGSDDYRYSLVNGKKPISIDIKRSFPNGRVNIENLAQYFEERININNKTYLPALIVIFNANSALKQDVKCLAMALALQFKSFIDEKESEEVPDIIASEYARLISEKNNSGVEVVSDICTSNKPHSSVEATADTDPKRITVINNGTVENQKFVSIETMNGDLYL
jgi:hypothetical protein